MSRMTRSASAAGAESLSTVIVPRAKDVRPLEWQAKKSRQRTLLAVLPPLILLLCWQWGAQVGSVDVRFFPAPSTILEKGWDLTTSGDLARHLSATLTRMFLGFPVGVAAGVVAGLAIGYFPTVRAMAEPSLVAIYSTPKLALYPLLLLIFGIGNAPKVILVALVTFLVLARGVGDAVQNIPGSYLDASAVFKASRLRMFCEVILPAVLPQIFTSIRLAIGFGLLVVVSTEFVNANEGVGWLIWHSWSLFQPPAMYVGIAVSALTGLLATTIVTLVGRLVMPWNKATLSERSALM